MAEPVIIVGGGLAGLSAARELHRHGRRVTILEAGDAVGGRVQTDRVGGFLCDRGFQVYLTSYPEPRRQLNTTPLELGRFTAGALVFDGSRLVRFSDPLRHPREAWQSLTSGVGTWADKLRLLKLARDARDLALHPTAVPDRTTLAELSDRGFSDEVIRKFLRPFLGGIFLDAQLQTSARMLMFVFGMFAKGRAALPAGGMQAIPRQLADRLPQGTVRLKTSVAAIGPGGVTLPDGETVAGRVVLAVDEPSARRLLNGGGPVDEGGPEAAAGASLGQSTTTLYFTADTCPIGEATLVLNGTGEGRVNTVASLTAAQPAYSRNGRPLLSCSLIGRQTDETDALAEAVRGELSAWFDGAKQWQFVHRCDVPYALPDQSAGTRRPPGIETREEAIVCGDWRSFGSIHHAMASGRAAAAAVLRTP